MNAIIFEVTEDEVDGGFSASAVGYGIHTQADSMEEMRRNVREAVDCYFDETMERPTITRLRRRPHALRKPSASRLPLAQTLFRVFPTRSSQTETIPPIDNLPQATSLQTPCRRVRTLPARNLTSVDRLLRFASNSDLTASFPPFARHRTREGSETRECPK